VRLKSINVAASLKTKGWAYIPNFDIGDYVYVVYDKEGWVPIKGWVADMEDGPNGKYGIASDDPSVAAEAEHEADWYEKEAIKDGEEFNRDYFIDNYMLFVEPKYLRHAKDFEKQSSLVLS